MMNKTMTSKNGIRLLTSGKYCDQNIEVVPDGQENIIPTNIRSGVSILGVDGNLEPDKPDQSKTCTPTTSQQVIQADTGYELAQVTVAGVTAAIDENIVAGNIKKDVVILGVTGTLEEGVTPSGNINITNMQQTNVANYATAQIVDANLIAANIAKDVVVLGITGTHEGGGGGSMPTLNAPTIAIAEDTMTITNPASNGTFVTSFGGYVNGTYCGMDTTETTVDLTAFELPEGDYNISATCKGTNFNESAQSNTVAYTNIFYGITNNLTHCTSNNSATQVRKGTSYSATFTTDSGYSISADNVTVTMGGVVVTGAYSDKRITIANVTGALVITVTATANTVITAGTYYPKNGGTVTYESGHTMPNWGTEAVTLHWASGSNKTLYSFGFYSTAKVYSSGDKQAHGWVGKESLTGSSYYYEVFGYKDELTTPTDGTAMTYNQNLQYIVLPSDKTVSLSDYNYFHEFFDEEATE